MEKFREVRTVGSFNSDSETESLSDRDRWLITPNSSQSAMHPGPMTSTEYPPSEELFTDSMVFDYRSPADNGSTLLSIPTPAPVLNFEWEERPSRSVAQPFDYTGSGWTVPLSHTMTEFDFWKTTFPQELLENLVQETNTYAAKIISMAVHRSRRQQNFKEISENEMLRYISVRILMGIDNKPEMVNYWSKDPMLRSLAIPQIMCSDRFFEIQRYLHLCNDEEETEQDERDKLRKIRKFWEDAMTHFGNLVVPSKELSVDESLTKFKGRLSFKQFIPSKRNRFGIKSYSLIDEDTKFVVNSIIYVGKDDTSELKYSKKEFGHGGAVLLHLCEPYFGKFRTIFADNYFTSPVVAAKLLSHQTYLCGTLRAGRKFTPKAPKLKNDEMVTFCCEQENNDIMLEYWRDKRVVRVISTGKPHNVLETRNARGVVKRKLETICDYNKYARGTDQADMFIGYYDTSRKTMKWPTKMFFRLLELHIYNSFVMMRSFIPGKSFLEFRLNLVRQIIQSTGGVASHNNIRQVNAGSICEDRLTSRCVAPGKGTKRRCVVCAKHGKERRTIYLCKNCGVPLCVVPCFELYHTKKHY